MHVKEDLLQKQRERRESEKQQRKKRQSIKASVDGVANFNFSANVYLTRH
jgi:hypothetical protein